MHAAADNLLTLTPPYIHVSCLSFTCIDDPSIAPPIIIDDAPSMDADSSIHAYTLTDT